MVGGQQFLAKNLISIAWQEKFLTARGNRVFATWAICMRVCKKECVQVEGVHTLFYKDQLISAETWCSLS